MVNGLFYMHNPVSFYAFMYIYIFLYLCIYFHYLQTLFYVT